MTFSARSCQRHSTGQELIGSDEHLVAIWDLGNVILPCSSKLSFILTSCNNYETFWRSMWNDDFTDKTRQQSAIWLVLEPLTEQEGLARVCFLSSPAPTEWPRSPWKMHTGALGLIPPPHMGGPWAELSGQFQTMLATFPCAPPPPPPTEHGLSHQPGCGFGFEDIFSCKSCPWAFLRPAAQSLRLSKALLPPLFLHSINFSSRICHCKWCWCGSSGSKQQAWRWNLCKPTSFHCSDLSLRYLPRALTGYSCENAKCFSTYGPGTCNGKGTKTVLLLCIIQTYTNQIKC